LDWVTEYIEEFQYVAIALVLFLAGLGVPIPEDIPLIYGGVMAGQGKMDVTIHFVISMIFILIGDSCLYFIGKKISRGHSQIEQTRSKPSRLDKLLKPEMRIKVQSYFDRYGSWAVFFGRFVAGVRGAVFLTAGITGFSLKRFILLDGLAALISVPVWIGLGFWFGKRWTVILEIMKTYQLYVFAGIICVGIIWWLIRKYKH
jgi:membrane protein DedA with SNARE-associated domain